MSKVHLSLGSNLDPEVHLRRAVESLRAELDVRELSSVYRSPAVGFSGPDFFNAVVSAETTHTPQELASRLRTIEAELGRTRDGPKFSSRTIDLDLLTYDDLVIDDETLRIPHSDIERYSFVLIPLAEIVGPEIHPVLKRSYEALSRELDTQPLDLERMNIEL